MPLLPPEPNSFPEDLFSSPTPIAGDWWVLHTKPRCEKSLARELSRLQIAHFLPTYMTRKRQNGRMQTSYLPLFTGYLFLKATSESRQKAFETNYVANSILVHDQARLQLDLERVHRLMTSDVPLGPEAKLIPGTPVSIIHGPLAGLVGKIIQRGNKLNFFIEVEMLKQGVSVEIESWMIEPNADAIASQARK
jgi:transcription antitermination factor NusG